jgi:hypothetical protein
MLLWTVFLDAGQRLSLDNVMQYNEAALPLVDDRFAFTRRLSMATFALHAQLWSIYLCRHATVRARAVHSASVRVWLGAHSTAQRGALVVGLRCTCMMRLWSWQPYVAHCARVDRHVRCAEGNAPAHCIGLPLGLAPALARSATLGAFRF